MDLWTLKLITPTSRTVSAIFITAVPAVVMTIAQPRRTYAQLKFTAKNSAQQIHVG